MTYAEAVARLLALRGGERTGMRPGLERIELLLDALGRPEDRYRLVQVGGTNGKGSTAAMLAAILQAGGRRVGLYTSPHLVSFRERIRVDGLPIPEDSVADGVEALGTLVARADATMFEATTALALDHFARERVEVAVLEVGLGGRLDATTVGEPAVSVLTRIDRDHEELLGSTLRAIAEEKAAIIRSGVAFAAAQTPEVTSVFERCAEAARVPIFLEDRDLRVQRRSCDLNGQLIDCAGPGFDLSGVHLAMLGSFQPSNALLAIAAARSLGATEAAIRAGLGRVRWPGRFQVFRRPGGYLVLDGAHNPAGAVALADSLRLVFGEAPVTIVLGVARDKDARGILDALAPAAQRLILTRSSNARSADPETLRALVAAPGPAVEVAATARQALSMAMNESSPPIVCVAGSLFLIGDVLREGLAGDKPWCQEKGADSIACLF